jgi:L-threonylcarbamoyladenylate synthase
MAKCMGWTSNLRLRLAARQIREGNIIAYPTESVWGLGCDPLNKQAVADLLTLKGRSVSKGLILIAADFEQIEPFLDIPSQREKSQLLASWPGPVTWIVSSTPETPTWLRGNRDTLAVRVTAHPTASALCRAFGGAIVSTSANPSGARPARTQLKTRRYFPSSQLRFLPGAVGDLNQPTAIYDARSGIKLR